MEHINPHLSDPYTILNDRILWFDGDSSYTVKSLANKILTGSTSWYENYVIDSEDFSVIQFNKLNDDIKLSAKPETVIPNDTYDWNIPEEYMNLSVKRVIYSRLYDEFSTNNFTAEEERERVNRVLQELKLWEELNMFNLLKTLMYIVDTFVENNIIWGTGRGSSCCSYILYLIGIHDVDSIFYNLEITDFFRV